MAVTVCEYAVPSIAGGSVAGFTVIAALIVTLYARAPVAARPSVAVTVKLLVAVVVGVPLIAPVAAFSESPAGKLPAETVNVYEPLPPVALTVGEYAVPSAPLGRVAGFTVIAALIVTLYARAPVAPRPSVAVMVKLEVAAVVGVPEIAPVAAFSESPAGKLPAETLNTYEPLPPVALTVCE